MSAVGLMLWPLSAVRSEPQDGRQWVALTNTVKLLLNLSTKNGWFIPRLVRVSPPGPMVTSPPLPLSKVAQLHRPVRGAHIWAALAALCPGQGAPCCGWGGCPCTWSGSSRGKGGSVDTPSLPPPSEFVGHWVARP